MKIPISALVPTRNRRDALGRTLRSLAKQTCQPLEIIIVDGSDNQLTEQLCHQGILGLQSAIRYYKAHDLGAAVQRIQAMQYATQNTIWFLDDDILFEPNCVGRLWNAIQSDPAFGGVNAMIVNQRYLPPGRISRALFRFLHGNHEQSYAGKCIGPAMNLLPEDRDDLPEVVSVEWLNTTCVMYRREALPQPLFPPSFKGYSLMEDVTLSLTVRKQWQLANVRTARIFHDSQPGDHKNNCAVLAKMELVNRHYVMTQVLHRQHPIDYFKLAVLQGFGIAAALQTRKGWRSLPAILQGNLSAIVQIITSEYSFPFSKKTTEASGSGTQ